MFLGSSPVACPPQAPAMKHFRYANPLTEPLSSALAFVRLHSAPGARFRSKKEPIRRSGTKRRVHLVGAALVAAPLRSKSCTAPMPISDAVMPARAAETSPHMGRRRSLRSFCDGFAGQGCHGGQRTQNRSKPPSRRVHELTSGAVDKGIQRVYLGHYRLILTYKTLTSRKPNPNPSTARSRYPADPAHPHSLTSAPSPPTASFWYRSWGHSSAARVRKVVSGQSVQQLVSHARSVEQ
jgi:hypothetical protein